MSATIGWDIGGANVKAARLEGGELRTRERPFALWREPARLPVVLREVAAELGGAECMGATMTAELADCFATKAEGVAAVLDALGAAFPDAAIRVWGTDGRFRSPDAARRDPLAVAAANWAASAALVARRFPDALLLDVGSTTTDIIPIVGGRVAAAGRTDPERLRSGELVYTGVLRTPICALLRRVRLAGGWHRTAAETFAIAADAQLWLGHIGPEEYTCDTPDGRGTDRQATAARLARVVCADPPMLAPGDIDRIARQADAAQLRRIAGAVRQLRARLGPAAPGVAVVAGSGKGLARRAAERAGLEVAEAPEEISPAAAVAVLLAEQA